MLQFDELRNLGFQVQ